MTDEKSRYNLDVARSQKQLEQMVDLQDRKVCAFCQQNITSEQKEPVELETDHWIVKKNDYPYANTTLHLLLIPKHHAKTFSDLDAPARTDFAETIVKVESKWSLTTYAVGMRSGDMRYNGGSVEHIHAHIVVGDVSDPSHEPVRFKMSARPKTTSS